MDEMEKRQFLADLSQQGLELGEPVRVARIIPAPAAAIWKEISTPGQLNKYHPYCRENKVYKWPGVGSRDGLVYHSGLYWERDFICWSEGVGWDLLIGPPPRKSAWIYWDLQHLGEAQTEMSLTATPILESHLLETTRKIYNQNFATSVEVYNDSFLRGVEHFVTTGQAVEARQFGTHPIFAP
jgi:hypothetical protein